MYPDAPYFSILSCLMLDDFILQVESAATQWVKLSFWYIKSQNILDCEYQLWHFHITSKRWAVLQFVKKVKRLF